MWVATLAAAIYAGYPSQCDLPTQAHAKHTPLLIRPVQHNLALLEATGVDADGKATQHLGAVQPTEG